MYELPIDVVRCTIGRNTFREVIGFHSHIERSKERKTHNSRPKNRNTADQHNATHAQVQEWYGPYGNLQRSTMESITYCYNVVSMFHGVPSLWLSSKEESSVSCGVLSDFLSEAGEIRKRSKTVRMIGKKVGRHLSFSTAGNCDEDTVPFLPPM